MMTKTKTLRSIGCGPRGASIGVNLEVLRTAGVMDHNYKAFECHSVGANWSGDVGYTDGNFTLDTSPLKDLVFPRSGFGTVVDRISTPYSFIEFLKTRGDSLERWVSAGTPLIPHRLFTRYQGWAVAEAGVDVEIACVERINIVGNQIELTSVKKHGCKIEELVDGVVLTGPGEPARLPEQDDCPASIFNAKTYWMHLNTVRDLPKGTEIAIIGAGQSAGTIARSVLTINPGVCVTIVNRFGFIPAQSAGLPENLMCSAAGENWTSIPLSQRAAILRRINSGVVDTSTKAYLDLNPNLSIVCGEVQSVRRSRDRVRIAFTHGSPREYDLVVIAAGFDPVASLSKLMPNAVEMDWFRELAAERILDYHLRIPRLPCNIHMPALAGLSQGPGLALLSCLATMSNRVLTAYGCTSRKSSA